MASYVGRVVKIANRKVTVFGYPDDLFFNSVCTIKDYDLHIPRIASLCIKDGDTILDIGANIGYFSLALSTFLQNKKINDYRILAFEPTKVNAEPLRDLLVTNIHYTGNIELEEYGLSSRNKKATINYSSDNHGGAHISAGLDEHYSKTETITLKRLSTVMRKKNIKKIDFIKLDIEGHEYTLLKSIETKIKRHKPAMVVEVNSWTTDVIGKMSTSEFVDYLCDLAPYVYGIDANGTYIDVQKEKMKYLSANLLGKTHQDVYLDYDKARVKRALATMKKAN